MLLRLSPSSIGTSAGGRRAPNFMTKIVQVGSGPSWRLGNRVPTIVRGHRRRRLLLLWRSTRRLSDQTRRSAQLGTKRRLLLPNPHSNLLLINPFAPNLYVTPRRQMVVTAEIQNHRELALRTVLVQERRSSWSVRIRPVVVLPFLAASPHHAMMALRRLRYGAMAVLRRSRRWNSPMAT